MQVNLLYRFVASVPFSRKPEMKILTHIRVYITVGILLSNATLAESSSINIKSWKALKRQDISLQTLDYSCGAAALSILLKGYFNHQEATEPVLLADLIYRLPSVEMENRVQYGFSMLDLKQVAERLGYQAVGLRLHPRSIERLDGPFIILLKSDELNHFVVLKGIRHGHAWIADPSRGNLRVAMHELVSQWTGESLIIDHDDFSRHYNHVLAVPSGVVPEQELVRSMQRVRLN